jgi:hypothetical protein
LIRARLHRTPHGSDWIKLLVLMVACDVGDVTPARDYDDYVCIATVCERLPTCSPVVFLRWRAWDWRSYQSCMATMTCADPERCMDAVDAMACGGPSERGVDEVRAACGGVVRLPPPRDRAIIPVPMK